jgi:hypothetical protein
MLWMSNKEQPPRGPKRRGFFGGLGKVMRPPLTTPQWKDAIREDEARGPTRRGRPKEP